MEAVVLCGIQGAGKSTFARRFAATHDHVSVDALGAAARQAVAACLAEGRPFVLDDLNVTEADRARWIAAARDAGFRVSAYAFDVRASVAVRRNRMRRPGAEVPWGGIVGTARRLQPPTLGEGFDAVYRVAEDGQVAPVAARAGARAA